jgi:putative glutathione S-transferase
MGNSITLADIHAFPHLIRFDCIFYVLFSLNKKHLWEYTNINRYLKTLLSNPDFATTIDLNEMKKGGFGSENNYPENLGCRKIPIGNGGCEHYF